MILEVRDNSNSYDAIRETASGSSFGPFSRFTVIIVRGKVHGGWGIGISDRQPMTHNHPYPVAAKNGTETFTLVSRPRGITATRNRRKVFPLPDDVFRRCIPSAIFLHSNRERRFSFAFDFVEGKPRRRSFSPARAPSRSAKEVSPREFRSSRKEFVGGENWFGDRLVSTSLVSALFLSSFGFRLWAIALVVGFHRHTFDKQF